MDQFERETIDLLTKIGAVLVRCKRHNIYRLPNGRNFVVSSSPGAGGSRNELSRLKRVIRQYKLLT